MRTYYLDANGTDGSDPRRVDRVYWDGTRQPASEPEIADARSALLAAIDGATTVAGLRTAIKALLVRLVEVE